MQTEPEVKQRRPFHETIVDAIRHAGSGQMEFAATLIKATKIPKDHKEIIEAWAQRRDEIGWDNDLGVQADLFDQRQEAEKKEEKRAKEQGAAGAS